MCALACCVTKWDKDCDRKLHRLMCYIYSTKHHRQVGFVGQEEHEVNPVLYTDADFAGDPETMRSTSGVHLDVSGIATKFPIIGISKKQTAVSHSTPEAEIVAGAFGLRTEGIPAAQLMDVLSKSRQNLADYLKPLSKRPCPRQPSRAQQHSVFFWGAGSCKSWLLT